VNSEVNFVPFFVKDPNAAEDERLEFAFKVVDAELDGRLSRIECHFELRPLADVADADDTPRRLGRLAGTERADEGELLRESLRENVPGGND